MESLRTMINVLLFLLAIPIGVTSYYVTRGSDGELLLCFELFAVWSAIYLGLCWISAKRLREVPFLPHMIVYLVAAVGPLFTATELEEMGGMMLGIVPICALCVPVPGLALLLVRAALRKESRT